MELFAVLPDRFFTLLVGKHRNIYAEAVLELYEQFKLSRVGIDYEIMRDLFQELIETKEEGGILFEVEEEGVVGTRESGNYRMKANALLRKLQQLAWIDVETRDNFRQSIVLPHYTIRMLGAMQELCEARSVEFQGYALNTYNLLISEEMERQPSLAIFQAESVTGQLLEELRILINNMKNQMEQVVAKQTLQEVLDHHFDIYMKNIVDRSYHRLKTSDHVARYRNRIIQVVQEWLLDSTLFEAAVADAVKNGTFEDKESAEQKLRQALQFIEEAYESLDELYGQIDIRHHQYLKSSYDRARYLTQHNQGIGQQIAKVLESRSMLEGEWDNAMEDIFQLHTTQLLSESSLLTPRVKKAVHEPMKHTVIAVSEEVKHAVRTKNLKKLEAAITREKIDRYVLGRLADRSEMGMAELVPRTIEEYVYLPFVYLYGYEKKASYSLIRKQEDQMLHIGHYKFKDRMIVRKAGKGI